MLKCFFCFFVFICLNGLPAQTKLIAHKSHSGGMDDFIASLKDGLPDFDNSNFGMAPERYITTSQLDSVIFVSDTLAVMVTSQYCIRSLDIKGSTMRSRWSPGRDTVIRHPLFSLQHQLDSIKKALKSDYFFRNDIDSVKFIGFDNRAIRHDRQQGKEPFPGSAGPDADQGPELLLLAGMILAASILAGLFSWKFIQS